MLRKRLALISLGLTCGLAAGLWAAPAGATPASPGACNMMNANAAGIAGMRGASDQGFENMIDLVLASLGAGCNP